MKGPFSTEQENGWRLKDTKFLCVPVTENFSLSLSTSSVAKKTQQRLFLLRRLRKSPSPFTQTNHILQRDYWEYPEQLHHYSGKWEQLRWSSAALSSLSQTSNTHAASAEPPALWKTPHTPRITSSTSCLVLFLPCTSCLVHFCTVPCLQVCTLCSLVFAHLHTCSLCCSVLFNVAHMHFSVTLC